MLISFDLANHEGPLLGYVEHGQDVVTLHFKFGSPESLNSSGVKFRFTAAQFRVFQALVAQSPEFPGYDLNQVPA